MKSKSHAQKNKDSRAKRMKGQELTNHNIMEFLKLLNKLSRLAFVYRLKNYSTRMIDEFVIPDRPAEEEYPTLTVNEALQFIRLSVSSMVYEEENKDADE